MHTWGMWGAALTDGERIVSFLTSDTKGEKTFERIQPGAKRCFPGLFQPQIAAQSYPLHCYCGINAFIYQFDPAKTSKANNQGVKRNQLATVTAELVSSI